MWDESVSFVDSQDQAGGASGRTHFASPLSLWTDAWK